MLDNSNQQIKKSLTTADWCISLICECPHCNETVDLLDDETFWEDRRLEVCEKRADVEVCCPECSGIFLCDTEY